jgi:hypothetical protein
MQRHCQQDLAYLAAVIELLRIRNNGKSCGNVRNNGRLAHGKSGSKPGLGSPVLKRFYGVPLICLFEMYGLN